MDTAPDLKYQKQVIALKRYSTIKYNKLDLAFNNVKPKDWYFVLDLVQFRIELGCVRLTNKTFGWRDQGHHSWYLATLLLKVRVD